MNVMNSILLLIDGSAESLLAAKMAWLFAKSTDSQITVQHVIETNHIWDFLSYSKTGFIGSGVYFAAHENITKELKSIAESLFMAYESRASGFGVKSLMKISEGNLVDEVNKEIVKHDLLILGHKSSEYNLLNEERRRFNRLSACERLIGNCPKPILLVQKEFQDIPTLQFMVGQLLFREDVINNVVKFAKKMRLDLEIFIVSRGQISEEIELSIAKFKSLYPELIIHLVLEENLNMLSFDNNDFASSENSLCVMSISKINNDNITSLGYGVNKIVNCLEKPALLLYPVN